MHALLLDINVILSIKEYSSEGRSEYHNMQMSTPCPER